MAHLDSEAADVEAGPAVPRGGDANEAGAPPNTTKVAEEVPSEPARVGETAEVSLQLQEEHHRIERMGIRQLRDWYQGVGLPEESDMTRQELVDLLKKVARWGLLALEDLRSEYEQAVLGSASGDESDSALLSKDDLVYKLLTHERMKAWETKGFQAKRIGKPETVMQVVMQCAHIESMSLAELLEWYKSAGFPMEQGLCRGDIAPLLKSVTVWHALPLPELREECAKQRVSGQLADVEPSDDDDALRNQLVDRLLVNAWLSAWDAKGFKAKRLGVDAAISAVAQLEAFRSLSDDDLRSTCKKAGLPEELLDARAGRDEALEALKNVLVWELMPLAELEKDCLERGVPTAKSTGGSEEATCDAPDGERDDDRHSELLQRLKLDLVVGKNRSKYEQKGIPVEYLNSWDIASLSHMLDQVEEMTKSALQEWYKGTGLPEEKGVKKDELAHLLRRVTVWHALPMKGLLQESVKSGVLTVAEVEAGAQDSERSRLMNQLLIRERLPCWEKRGFPIQRIGNSDTVVQAVAQYVHFQGLSTGDLRKMCKDVGLTKLVRFNMDKERLLQTLKTVLIWELLPLPELRKECSAKGLPSLVGRNGEREESIRWLVAATFCDTWSLRGVPAERLGSLDVAEALVANADRLEALVLYSDMIGRTTIALQNEYKKLGVPFDPKLGVPDLVQRLKDVMVWKHMPMPELLKECQTRNVSTTADASKMIAFMTETTKRSELIKRLIMTEWSASWQPRNIPAQKLDSLEALETLVQRIDRVKTLGDVALRAEFKKMKLQDNPSWGPEEMLRRLIEAIVWEQLPMDELHRECLQQGVTVGDAWTEYRRSAASADPSAKAPAPKAWRPGAPETWRPGDMAFPKPGGAEARPGAFGKGPAFQPGMVPKPFQGSLGSPFSKNSFGGLGLWKSRTPDAVAAKGGPAGALSAKSPGMAPPFPGLKDMAVPKRGSEDARRVMMSRLFDNARLREWEAQGVPATRIGDARRAIALLEPIDQMSPRELSDWYKAAGFPAEASMQKADIARLAKMVTIWEALPMYELDKISKEQGLPGASECKGSTDEGKRLQLVERLLVAEQMQRWEAAGFEALRIGDVSRVMQAVARYDEFQRMSDADLRKVCIDAGMPEVEGMERDVALRALKTVLLWELMPLAELQRECLERSLSLDVEGASTDEERRLEYAQLLRVDLTVRMSKAWYEAKGVPVSRLGTVMASRVAAQFKHIDGRTSKELMDWYKSLGFPQEKGMSDADIVDLWKRVTVWSCLPPGELRSECERAKVSLSGVIRAGDLDEQREQLVFQLLLTDRFTAWELRGIEAKRLGADEAIQAVAQLEDFRAMGEAELRKVYSDVGLPEVEGVGTEDILSALTTVLTWELLPHLELEKDCRERRIPVVHDDLGATASVAEKHAHLLQQLKVDLKVSLSRGTYEAKGIPVGKLGSWHTLNVAERMDEFQAMGNDELKAQYLNAGLPEHGPLEREFLLRSLLKVLVWENLSLQELQRECLERHLPIQVAHLTHEDKEGELVRRLITDFSVDMQRTAFEQQGIPVSRLGSLATASVAAQFDKIERMTAQRLADAYQERGLPPEPSASRGELVARLRDVVLLEALPAAELRAECARRSVAVPSLPIAMPEDEAKEQVLDALKFSMFRRAFDAMSLPTHVLRTFKAASSIAREWTVIEAMLDSDVARRYVDLGLSPQYMRPREVRDRLKQVALWLAIPFKDLQHECVVNQVNSYTKEGDRHTLVRRLAAQLWPPRPNPNAPRPPPPPRPPPRPPPPRPPPLYVPAQNKMAQYFRALELPLTAGFEDVKKAYRRLALKHHPDKNQGPAQEHASRAFRVVAEAYEKLSEHFKVKGRPGPS